MRAVVEFAKMIVALSLLVAFKLIFGWLHSL